MQFVDTITPASPVQYQNNIYAGEKSLKDSHFQLRNDWASMYYQNAYNTAMVNYMNEYNTPLQQMLRYQDAGLSKWNAAATPDPGNMSDRANGAAPHGNFRAPSQLEQRVKTLQAINDVVGAATEMYDYMTYGAKTNEYTMQAAKYNRGIALYNYGLKENELDWSNWWNRGVVRTDPETGQVMPTYDVGNSPRASYMQMSTNEKAARINQLQSLVDVIYPNQADALAAKAALDRYNKEILEGKNDAILQISTGNDTSDNILRLLVYQLLNSQNALIGLAGKML